MRARGPRGEPGKGFPGLPGGPLALPWAPGPHGCPSLLGAVFERAPLGQWLSEKLGELDTSAL